MIVILKTESNENKTDPLYRGRENDNPQAGFGFVNPVVAFAIDIGQGIIEVVASCEAEQDSDQWSEIEKAWGKSAPGYLLKTTMLAHLCSSGKTRRALTKRPTARC